MRLNYILYGDLQGYLQGQHPFLQDAKQSAAIVNTVVEAKDVKRSAVIIPKKFQDDILRLQDYVGESSFLPGLCIEVSLRELITIVPRDRRRRDAYNALQKFLEDEMNITLKINSLKTVKE